MTIEPTEHGTAVAIDGRGVFIAGPSGYGKTQLALTLVRRARLADIDAGIIADDRVVIAAHKGEVVASAPQALAGKIEIRGFGICALDDAQSPPTPIRLYVALTEPDNSVRMHDGETQVLAGEAIPLLSLPRNAPEANASAIFAALGFPVWI